MVSEILSLPAIVDYAIPLVGGALLVAFPGFFTKERNTPGAEATSKRLRRMGMILIVGGVLLALVKIIGDVRRQ